VNRFVPSNDLDRALAALRRSRSATPEFYRQLATGDLWFLVRYHPELENEDMQIQGGSPLPFVVLQDEAGEVVPLFSSEERLEEGLENGKVPPRTYLAGSMAARQVLEILGATELRAIVNKSCATGSVVIPPDLMRDLANGTALKSSSLDRPTVEKVLSRLDPADYPTNLIQPVFEHMRRHANFRAAWVFGPPKGAGDAEGKPVYQLTILMEPRDEALFHDFNLVAQAAKGKACEVELSLLDETDATEIARLFRQAQPFYVAADYGRPETADN
jgi:SseB protein N-terminal domain/SseB protein C-terminal domain